MLELPDSKVNRSVDAINIDFNVFNDWLEASLLFGIAPITKNLIVDVLLEEDICVEQDYARLIADESWSKLENRISNKKTNPTLAIEAENITATHNWTENVARSFFLTISLNPYYKEWAKTNRDNPGQGRLFERLIVELCPFIFKGWKVLPIGWSSTTTASLPELVTFISSALSCAGAADVYEWASRFSKDAGLDIICYRSFDDGRQPVPVYFIQCASGADWTSKLTEPPVDNWRMLLQYAHSPTRALAIPYNVSEREMRIRCTEINGPLFDRDRLLSIIPDDNSWLSPELRDDLITWLQTRIESLPRRI